MAPALNEPMNPTENLSTSAAKTSNSPTRSLKALDDAVSTTTPTPITIGSNIGSEQEEKKPNISSSSATSSSSSSSSTRVTRSKDAYQRIFEQTVAPAISLTPPPPQSSSESPKNDVSSPESEDADLKQKEGRSNNQGIGLGVILRDSKDIAETEFSDIEGSEPLSNSNINNNNNTNISSKCNSTEQLLADLTNDIEESITTKVCIRKTLTEDKNSPNVSPTEPRRPLLETKDIPAVQTEGSLSKVSEVITDAIVAHSAKTEDLRPVEAGDAGESEKTDNVSGLTLKACSQKPTTCVKKGITNDISNVAVDMQTTVKTSDSIATPSSMSTQVPDSGVVINRKLQILSVDVLPPISTDSTMTASEVEDNLEERLSQLDGTAVASPLCDDMNSVGSRIAESGNLPTTPPRTPTKQQTHQQQIKQLQQQLQQTPTTSLSPQQHQQHIQQQHTYTPQSTSSINTVNSANLPPAFMKESSAGELEDQDIEEVLKVLKGFDGSAGADTLCDLNVLFNEEYTLINYEEVSSQQSATTVSLKPSPLKEMQSEIERNQQTMQRRIDFLLRRMRKIQSRYMSKHSSEEIAGLFEWTARAYADKRSTQNTVPNVLQTDTAVSVIAARPPASNWVEEKCPVSSIQMSSMLRRLEQSSSAQQLCMMATTTGNSNATHNAQYTRKTKKGALLQEMQTSGSTSATAGERKGEVVVPHYDINVSEEMCQVSGLLQTEMREIQMAMDSDATESSSGGESADEMVTYNNQIQQPLAIAKRAAWRYSRDRAAIAARWSWLLSQIADLEIKIRQHTELRQELTRTKGTVVGAVEEQGAHSGPVLNTTASSVNGYKGNLLGNSGSKIEAYEANEISQAGAARTRGFVPSLFRKRKLLQTQGLHTISKKAARPSNIKCGCQWPLNPCAICTGRTDPTAPRDPPDTMMLPDRIALLDPSYHPVLSFREDVSSTLHLEAVARVPEWQQRVLRCQVKSIAKSVWKAEREAERAAGHGTSKKYNEPVVKRRYIKKKDRLAAEEKNAAAAAAAMAPATATSTSKNIPEAGLVAADTKTNQLATASTGIAEGVEAVVGAGMIGGGGSGLVLGDASALSASAAAAGIATTSTMALPTCVGGNGTGILSTSSTTTPLVANKLAKNSKKAKAQHHYHLVGDGVLVEPLSPVATNHSGHSQSSSHHSQQSGNSTYIHQTSDNLPQNHDQYNRSPIHSSLISNNNTTSNGFSASGGGGGGGIGNNKNKYRKGSMTNTATGAITNFSASFNNSSYHYPSNYSNTNYTHFTSESNDANWDGFASRSRTSSPTHGTSSNYYKYERSKNRTSYDIDNIVIPYSVAAATRVEILPYKEIPTPKWRVIDEDRVNTEQTLECATEVKETNALAGGNLDLDQNMIEANDGRQHIGKMTEIKSMENSATKTISIAEANKSDANEAANNEAASKSNNADWHSAEIVKNGDVPDGAIEPKEKRAKLESSIINHENDQTVSKKHNNKDALAAAITKSSPKAIGHSKRRMRLKYGGSPTKGTAKFMTPDGELPEIEDITDDAITLRHERALTEERRKFKTYLKFPWSTRSRANRRIDSRAESSGANTPDPTSPAPQTSSMGGGDQESIPSPLAPSTPLNPLDTNAEVGDNGLNNPPINAINNGLSKHLERRRTTSAKKDRDLERRSSTPDPKELVPPYEPLNFPLSDEALDELLKAMPVEFHSLDFDSKYLEDCNSSATKHSRQRNNWRSDGSTAGNRRGKVATTTQNSDASSNHNTTSKRRPRVKNNNNSRRGGRGRSSRTNNSRPCADLVNGTSGAGDVDDSDDDEIDLLTLLAAEDDDGDYPKHHLAPNDDLFDGGGADFCGGTAMNGNTRNRLMDIDDEYDAYLGRQRLGSESDSTDSEPFGDDDPNDPEWRGESEEGGGGGVSGSDRYRRNLR